jgi:hypothetical protein
MLAGDLHDFPLRDVLRLLADGNKSGAIHVERADEQGRIVLADGGVAAVGVGDRLVAAGDDVFVEAAAQLLGWREGTFRFEGDTNGDGVGEPAAAAVTVADLLQHAATRAERLVALADAQGPRTVTVALATAPGPDDVVLPAPLWDLAITIGDGRSIEDLATRTGASELTVRELVDDLSRAGLATVGDAASEATAGDGDVDHGVHGPAADDSAEELDGSDVHAASAVDGAGVTADAASSGDGAGVSSSDVAVSVGDGAQDVSSGDGNLAPDVLARVVKGLEAR